MRLAHRWLVLSTTVLLLAGCSGFVDQVQPHTNLGARVTLEPDHPIGQTFVARHAGLSSVEVWLEPTQTAQGEVRLHLRDDPETGEDLITAALPLAQVTKPGFHRLSFVPLRNSHGRYYYAFLEMVGDGAVGVGVGPGDAYWEGALYRDHQPLDAQMAFRLTYDRRWMLLNLGQAALGGTGLLLMTVLSCVVPGWALLAWLRPGRGLLWAERLGVAVGLSLALYPLLFLWTDALGLHLGPLYVWLPVVGGVIAIVWSHRTWRPQQCWETFRQWVRSEALWPDLAFLASAGLIIGVRLLVVRGLDAPMWGDSYQHTLIAQLLMDHGGMFDSWEPYVPYRSLTVHFGFPVVTTVLAWAMGLGSVRATLLAGQLVNSLAALALFPLAVRIADGNRWAGVGAILTAGLVSPMPAQYVNWGRYAQLAGQTVLPGALWLLLEAVRRNSFSWKMALLAGGALAGMTLAYYRMPFYYAVFVLAWLVGWGLPRWRGSARQWLRGFARLTLIASLAMLFFLPWGLHIAGGHVATALRAGLVKDTPLTRVLADYQVWRHIASYVPLPLLIAATIALAWSLAQRRWAVASVGLWILGLASLVAGRLIRLPGANMMQNYAVLIALYIPVSLLIGWLISQMAEVAGKWKKKVGHPILALLIVAAGIWGAAGQVRIVQPRFIMVTRPDVRAMEWIRENTSSGARFLVEGFRIYKGNSAVGADAGWWIPLLAGRKNTMPPQYALVNEAPADPGYTQRVVDLVTALESFSPTSPEGIRTLCDWDTTHVYVGQGQGEIGAGAVQLFFPADLAASPAFSTVYHQDRVHIFELNPLACEAGGE